MPDDVKNETGVVDWQLSELYEVEIPGAIRRQAGPPFVAVYCTSNKGDSYDQIVA